MASPNTDLFNSQNPLEISFLFIPFDAAKKFARAASEKGTNTVSMEVEIGGSGEAHIRNYTNEDPVQSDAPGTSPDTNSITASNVVERYVERVAQSEAAQSSAPIGSLMSKKISTSNFERFAPTFIALSEDPKGNLSHPDTITIVNSINYIKIGSTQVKTRRVQTISVYVNCKEISNGQLNRQGLACEVDSVRESHAFSTGSVMENMVKLRVTYNSKTIIGILCVHLSSKLVAIKDSLVRKAENNRCKDLLEKHECHYMVGDFNYDVRITTSDAGHAIAMGEAGCVLLMGDTANPGIQAIIGPTHLSNSSGTKCYMGYVERPNPTAATVHRSGVLGTMMGGSLPPCTGDSTSPDYHSDHTSLYLRFIVD